MAGSCLFKLRKQLTSKALGKNTRKKGNNDISCSDAKLILKWFLHLESTNERAQQSFRDISTHTKSEEYGPGSLTHPSVALYDFAMMVERLRLPFHSTDGVHLYKYAVLSRCSLSVLRNEMVHNTWLSIFGNDGIDKELAQYLMRLFITKFRNVLHNQFRREFHDKLNRKKNWPTELLIRAAVTLRSQ